MEVMTSQELLRQHMTDSAIEKTLRTSARKKKKKKYDDYVKDDDGYVNCPQCHKQIKSEGLTTHLRTHIIDKAFHCKQCDGQFKTKKYLSRHVSTVHLNEGFNFKCTYCEKLFRTPYTLKQHELIHTGEKPHKCDVCGKAFRAHYGLSTHMLIHTDEKPYSCAFCEYKCRDSSTIRKHQERHLGSVERFHCKICTKSYNSKSRLKVHIAQDHLNLEETKVECHLCHNKYRDNRGLASHIKRIHERATVTQCDVCDKSMDEGNLLAHLRTHCHIRVYKCDYPVCGKRFKSKADVKKHSVIHYPSQQKTCKECGRMFSKAYRYEKHIREGHKPRQRTEKCGVCKVMFYTKNHLLKHMHMKHSKKKRQYKCAHCNFSTAIKPSLIGHLKAHEHDYTKQFKKILKVKLQRDPILDSYFISNNNNNSDENNSESNPNNINDSDTEVENDTSVVVNDTVTVDTSTTKNDISNAKNIATDEGTSEESSNVSEKTDQSSVLGNNTNVRSDDTSAVHYNTTETDLTNKNIENKTKTDIPDTNGIQIVNTVSLSIPKDVTTQVTSKNTDINNTLKKNNDLTILCNGIDTETNTSYWDISDKNEPRIVQEKRVIEINVELKTGEDGNTVVNILGQNEEELNEISTITNPDVKSNISNSERMKNIVDNNKAICNEKALKTITLESNKGSIKKHSNVQLKEAIVLENDSEIIIKEVYSDIVISDSNDLTGSLRDLENSYVKSGNEIPSSETGSLNQIEDAACKDTSINNERFLEHNNDSQNALLPDIGGLISESDEQMSQVADLLSENDSPYIEIYMAVTETEDHNSETQSHNSETQSNNLNTHNDLRTQIGNLENIAQGLDSNSRNKSNERRNSDKERRELNSNSYDLESNDLENVVNDSENEHSENDSKNESHDLQHEKLDVPTTSKTIEDTSGYKKLNSKMIKFNTSQCYVCFKLFRTKEELIHHCKQHFGICSENRLKKCPLCSFVGREYLRKHLLTNHNIDIDQGKYNSIETNEEGTFTIKVVQKQTKNDINVKNIEIIPSIKQLNMHAYQKIDEKVRINKKNNIVKRKLVKKGKEWIVETENVKLNYLDYLLPIGKDSNSKPDETGEFDYLEQLTKLSNNAKKEDRTILYPCDRCELICTNMAALKAHRKSHDKIKTGKRKPKPTKTEIPRKINKNDLKNKDPKLLEFFESNMNGVDLDDFEQFTQIYKVIDGLSDDKLALAATNKEYGLFNLPKDSTTVNFEQNNKSHNKIRNKCNLNRQSGFKKVVKINAKLKEKRKAMQSKLRDKINRNKND